MKGCWNRNAATDLKDQLIDRYLGEHKTSHGLYVVGWFNSEPWRSGPRRNADRGSPLMRYNDASLQAPNKSGLANTQRVQPLVLDLSLL